MLRVRIVRDSQRGATGGWALKQQAANCDGDFSVREWVWPLAGVEPFCRAYGSFKTKPGLEFWRGGGLSFAGQRVQAARLRSAPRWGSAAATAEVLQRALDPPDSLRLAWPGVRREAWARRDHVPYLHTEAFIAPGLMIIALIRSFITARMEMSGYAFAC